MVTSITDGAPCFNDVYPMVAKESSVANPPKVAKIYEKWGKDGLATLHLQMIYLIPRYYW
jgi:hypothetical protein